MWKLFNKKEKQLYAFANGQSVPLEEVPDVVFAKKMMGEGIAIIPETGVIYAPIDGTVTMIMENTKHAIGMVSEDGLEILIHIGLDTIELAGEGFELLVKNNMAVKAGQALIQFDLDVIKARELNPITMMVITEAGQHQLTRFYTNQALQPAISPVIEYK